ncbi:MAG: glycosyltransferase [candidate division Zixibacteria bacterium]|nr:glycosyltransferase [candidate division Zixibacteria bacterium]
MRILYLNYAASTPYRVLGMADGLEKQGHEVRLVHLNPLIDKGLKGELHPREIAPEESDRKFGMRGILKETLRMMLSNLKTIPREIQLIRKYKPQLVLARWEATWSTFITTKLLRIPFILDTDGPMIEAFQFGQNAAPQFYLRIEKFLVKHAPAVTVISDEMAEHYRGFGLSPKQIEVCPNGIDPDRFNPEVNVKTVSRKYGIQDKIIIGFMGNIAPWHGLHNLLRQFPQIASKYANTVLFLIGFELNSDNLEEQLRDNLEPYNDRIISTGRIDSSEIPSHLKAIDIAVLPYPYMEFFYFSPVKLFEYMAVGCAVVAPDTGQISEVISDSENGLLFPAGDHRVLAEKIETLLENPDLRKKLGENAAKDVVRSFTWEKCAAGYEILFRRVYGKAK